MAMAKHRRVNPMMGYFQAGSLLGRRASQLLSGEPPSDAARDDAPPAWVTLSSI